MGKTLLTEAEVLTLTKANRQIPPCSLADIRAVEYRERRTSLGKDFYDALVSALVDYSTAPEYTGGTTYQIDDVVLYQGLYYKAKAVTSALPTLATAWSLAPKFSEADLENLWCEHLGRYLALLVLQMSVAPLVTPLTAAGAVKINGETFDPAKESEVLTLKEWVNTQVKIAFDNLDDYLNENGTNPLYSSYAGIETGTESTTEERNKAGGWADEYLIGLTPTPSRPTTEDNPWYCP